MTSEEIANRFRYHPPRRPGIAEMHELIRTMGNTLAQSLDQVLPDSDEKVRAVNAVDDACMYANAAVARHMNDSDEPLPLIAVDTTSADVDESDETFDPVSQVAKILVAEARDGESATEVNLRLLRELVIVARPDVARLRAALDERMAAENWRPDWSEVAPAAAESRERDDR